MRHPHLQFVVALVVIGPLLAMAGMSATGAWAPVGVGLGALLVAVAAHRSTRHSWADRETWQPMRWRMMAVTLIVSMAAALLAVGSVVWLVLTLIR